MSIVRSSLILSFWLFFAAIASAADRPNILWIVAEDMSPTLGCYGDRYATSPNIDRLATKSVRYSNAFATAPVCSPSRSCLITGCYATSLGTQQMRSAFPIPDFIRGFPALLREAGYYTSNNFKTDYNTSSADRIIEESWDESSQTAHWRKRADKAKPFFSIFNIMTSHQSRSMVYTQKLFRDEVQSKISQADIHVPEDAPVPAYYPDTLVTRRIVARYYDCVTAMDAQVGQILMQLEEDGLAEDTIVFFYSDHGSGMPRHKRLLHDSGMHVPLLVHVPKKFAHLAPVDSAEVNDRLVSFVDFAPTVLNLVGLDVPGHMQGSAFLGQRVTGERDYVYGHRDRIDEVVDLSRSVRDKRYLYIRNFFPHRSWNQFSSYSDLSEIRHELYRIAEGSEMSAPQAHYAGPAKLPEELYDCVADPHNLVNLAEVPEHAETLTRLRKALMMHVKERRDLGFVPEIEAWQMFAGSTPWEVSWGTGKLAEQATHPSSLTAQAVMLLEEPAAAARWVDADRSALRYWSAIALQGMHINGPQRVRLREGLRDDSIAVRIEMASALCRQGEMRRGLPVLERLLEHKDLNVVLYATRAIELLGSAAADALPAMQKVADRAEKLQASDTKAVFNQSGEKDLAMFCSFSANGFISRLKQGRWQHLIPEDGLTGWSNVDQGEVKPADGRQITMLSPGKNLWIAHNDEFRDFELIADVQMPTDEYNGGIAFRCQVAENGRPTGYQCEVAEELSGMLFAIGSGGWVWPKGDDQREQFFAEVGDAFRPGKWNHFRIRCEGDHIQIWVNGILATDIEDDRHESGRICLQHHGKGGIHRYRNVAVRRLNGE